MNSRISASQPGLDTAPSAVVPELPSDRELSLNGRDYWLLAALFSVAAVAYLWFFYSRNEILLSGDAVAHISIARRVFDSRTPGLLQLGSVWLPLPHLLTIPFIIIKPMWQSGIGGSIVSVLSYVLAGLGLFRLLRPWSRVAAWTASVFFALNPNLLYVQSTALNEPLYLATFVWTSVFFAEAWRALSQGGTIVRKSLEMGAIALTAAIFTRYDGWFLACMCWATFLIRAIPHVRRTPGGAIYLLKMASKPLLLTVLGVTLWLAYNFGVYKNPLNFANGPYSAKAIAQRTTEQGAPPYPGQHHLLTAGVYFVKAAQLNVGEGRPAKVLLLIAATGSLAFALRRDWFPVALLWSPLVFYSLSIAYGSVPIFVPVWWPFSYYNVRYGLELLPAVAAGVGLSILMVRESWRREWSQPATIAIIVLLAAVSYVQCWQRTPLCLREVRANGSARVELECRLASLVKGLPPKSSILAYTGTHGGAFQLAGVPLRNTINEGNLFLWDVALAQPATAVDYVIATDGDPVQTAVQNYPNGLIEIASVKVAGQPRTVIYKTSRQK